MAWRNLTVVTLDIFISVHFYSFRFVSFRFISFRFTNYSKSLQDIKFVNVVPKGGNLNYNGDSRVGKLTFENLKMSNLSWGKPLIGALQQSIWFFCNTHKSPNWILTRSN